MKKQTTYIKAVLVVFGILILTRIPGFLSGTIDSLLLISTAVELIFLVWGIMTLRK
jgi:hypothetical protein